MSPLAPIPPLRAADAPAGAASQRPSAMPTEPGPDARAPGTPNPSLRLDPALGLVVLEFRDRQGRTATLPTEKELEAYRSAGSRRESGAASMGADPQERAPRSVETTA